MQLADLTEFAQTVNRGGYATFCHSNLSGPDFCPTLSASIIRDRKELCWWGVFCEFFHSFQVHVVKFSFQRYSFEPATRKYMCHLAATTTCLWDWARWSVCGFASQYLGKRLFLYFLELVSAWHSNSSCSLGIYLAMSSLFTYEAVSHIWSTSDLSRCRELVKNRSNIFLCMWSGMAQLLPSVACCRPRHT